MPGHFVATFKRAATRPWLLWLLVVLFAADFAVGNLATTVHYDALHLLRAGWALLHSPSSLYSPSIPALSAGRLPEHGLLGPPAEAALVAPFALLPGGLAMPIWVWGDVVAAVAGLVVLQRAIQPRGVAIPLYWLIAAYFPPLFADVNAGQVGGYLLLMGCLAIAWASRHPARAGMAAGLAGAIKFYPLALILGARRFFPRYVPALIGTFVVVSALSFIPLGIQGPYNYLRQVFWPSLNASHFECAITSVSSFFDRTIGGQAWPVITDHGVVTYRLPLHLPGVANALGDATLLVAVVLAFIGARRSHWRPIYGAALGFALGAIIPGELYPYQLLPLLPLVLVVMAKLIERGQTKMLALLLVGLLGFVQQPCSLVFPNLWTVADLWVFGVCVAVAPLFAPVVEYKAIRG